MNDQIVDTTVIFQCAECQTEIKRKQKTYSLKDFKFMSELQPNFYFIDSGTGEYFIIVRPICETCQT